jgi:sortase (surface protein transpeptidase)
MGRSSREGSRRPAAAWIAVGLALVGVVLLGVALARPSTPEPASAEAPTGPSVTSTPPTSPGPTSARRSPESEEAEVQDRITGLVLPESDPVAVSIPSLGVRSSLVELGLDDQGAMEVPAPARAGWFNRGAAPGALGPAVIAGHVTWDGAPAIFHRLGTMRRGDLVTVRREDGQDAVFTVERVARFAKAEFPSRAVYGAIDHAGLRLITCGGTYDAARNRYLDNVIVFARLESARSSRG